ncbi:hypothetical protein MJO29_016025 [Puccinia striiformis f. sp. tritici]|nr:hypothetical protein MJO29_016025 [Puccinia striiformis f. sp. tritici]
MRYGGWSTRVQRSKKKKHGKKERKKEKVGRKKEEVVKKKENGKEGRKRKKRKEAEAMKRTNPESRPSFGDHQNNNEPNQNNNNLEAFRAAASLKIAAKRNRINKESTTFNPIKTHLPTTFVQGLTQPQDQFHPILEIGKLAIKNLKSQPEENTPFYQNSLSVLGDALDDILHVPPKPTAISLTTLSGACQALVQAGPKWSECLYDQVKDRLSQKTIEIHHQLLEGIPSDPAIESLLLSSNSIDFFKTIDLFDPHTASSWLIKTHSIWNGWYNQLKLIRCLLIHLDRFILARSDTLIPIWELGLDLFRKNVIGRPWNPISLTLSIVISQQITIERTSGTISYGLIRSITDLSYTAFGSKGFTSLISVSLIQTTESFYKQEGTRMIDDIESNLMSIEGPFGYLSNIKIRLESETELFNKIFTTPARALNAKLLNTIIRSIETNLIQAHLDVLLSKGLVRLLEGFPDRSSADSLSTFYSLLSRLGDPSPLQQLRTCFSKWIKQVGLSMVTETTTNEDQESGNRIGSGMIESLIEFKTKLDRIVIDCFLSDREMFYAIKESFEFFINHQRQNKLAESLAKFLDSKIRTNLNKLNEIEIDNFLSQILIIFRFSQDKDIFEEFYKKDLAKRLLLSKSNSIDLEKNMVMKLKKECGPGFTAKLEMMFRDLETSNDLNIAYEKARLKARRAEEQQQQGEEKGSSKEEVVDLTVTILTSGSWPISQSTEPKVILPSRLSNQLNKFEKFYAIKYLGRTLTWTHSLGQVVLTASFPIPTPNNPVEIGTKLVKKVVKKEFTVSTIQALVLLLFNDLHSDLQSIDFLSIVERTGIDEITAARTLQSLACGKVKILIKNPKSKNVSKSDQFSFNSNFKDDHFKIKINQIQSKETVEERSKTVTKVVTDRSTMIQLSIVRIMKSRQKLKFNTLILDLIESLKNRFQVEVKDVKVAIENLIARDYLERVGVDEFQYLA